MSLQQILSAPQVTVEYGGAVYRDARRVNDAWYYLDSAGVAYRFRLQYAVCPLSGENSNQRWFYPMPPTLKDSMAPSVSAAAD